MNWRLSSVVLPCGLVLSACSSSSSPSSAKDAGGQNEAATDAGGDAGADAGGEAGADAGTPTCAEFATTYCAFENACHPGDLQASWGTVQNCVTVRTSQCTSDAAATGTGVTPAYLTACSAQLTQNVAACSAGPVPDRVATPNGACQIIGAGAAGAPCGIDAECATDVCLRSGALCGTCTSQGAAGEGCDLATGVTCAAGLQCTNATCVKVSGLAGTCDMGLTTVCVGGTSCVVAQAGGTSGTCQASGAAVGAMCDPNAVGVPNCFGAAGLFCDATSHCAAIGYGASGAMCGAPNTHVSNNECLEGDCVSGSCVGKVASGGMCQLNGSPTCVEQSVCVVSGGGVAGTCTTTDNMGCKSATLAENFTFQPSNVSLSAINLAAAMAQDESVSAACAVSTDSTSGGCFQSPMTSVKQPDGSTVKLIVVRSLDVQAGAVVTVTGGVPLVIVSLSDVTWFGQLAANSSSTALAVGAGGGAPAASDGVGLGAGGGKGGSGTTAIGGGGGSYCGIGGTGGGAASTSAAYGGVDVRPLVGGSAGGGGVIASGAGGGGVQIVAAGTITLKAGSSITVGGQGGPSGGVAADQNAGGAGSGGSILLEAQTVVVDGTLAANGGGGGGDYSATSSDATADATPAAGAAGGTSGGAGGAGGAGATVNGAAGKVTAGINAGGGGGGVGRIRVNTVTGVAGGTGTYSPAASTPCATQGMVRAPGSGA